MRWSLRGYTRWPIQGGHSGCSLSGAENVWGAQRPRGSLRVAHICHNWTVLRVRGHPAKTRQECSTNSTGRSLPWYSGAFVLCDTFVIGPAISSCWVRKVQGYQTDFMQTAFAWSAEPPHPSPESLQPVADTLTLPSSTSFPLPLKGPEPPEDNRKR